VRQEGKAIEQVVAQLSEGDPALQRLVKMREAPLMAQVF